MTIRFGSETVRLVHVANAHTDGDTYVWFKTANVLSTGDTPNANKFRDVRVYSLSAPMTGCGFFLSTARFNNSFIDCEANLHPSAEACFRLGAMTDQTRILNFYAECSGAVPGIRIDNSSTNTTIIGLFSATGGIGRRPARWSKPRGQ